MKLARVKGSVTATAKDAQLVGHALLLCDCVDEQDNVVEAAIVAADTVGAGAGDRVLIITGSAARLASSISGLPVDAAIVAIVDDVRV
ncbi:MAG: EutN/CcmL family microcompartment protein [Ahrensia sp.]|nr:EutN/CcmL family microcompartment protein [Ahrensia sp.]